MSDTTDKPKGQALREQAEGAEMKWRKVSAYCIEAEGYRISKFVLGGQELYRVYHGEELVGDAPDGNRARKVAEKHAAGETA